MPFKIVERVCKVALSPDHGGTKQSIEEGLTSHFNKGLLQYDTVLGGIILAYDQVQILDPDTGSPESAQKKARLIAGLPWLHLSIHLRFLVLGIQTEDVVLASVNKMSSEHIGLLLYDNFNISVSRDRILPDYQYQAVAGNEVGAGEDISANPASDEHGYWSHPQNAINDIVKGNKLHVKILQRTRKDGAVHFTASMLDEDEARKALKKMTERRLEMFTAYAGRPGNEAVLADYQAFKANKKALETANLSNSASSPKKKKKKKM